MSDLNTFHTIPDEVRDVWSDAPEDATLIELMQIAQEQVLAYAPALDPLVYLTVNDCPTNYRYAQLQQMKNIWTSEVVSPSTGEFGEGTYARSAHPLDWMIKQILRPRKAVPRVR